MNGAEAVLIVSATIVAIGFVAARDPRLELGTVFTVRIGNSTREVAGSELLQYAVRRWTATTLAGRRRTAVRARSRGGAAPAPTGKAG